MYYILDIFYNSYKQFIANISFHADDCQMLTNEIKISHIVQISGQADGTQKWTHQGQSHPTHLSSFITKQIK